MNDTATVGNGTLTVENNSTIKASSGYLNIGIDGNMCTSGYSHISSHISTQQFVDDDNKVIHKYLLPFINIVDINTSFILGTEDESASLHIWVEPEVLEDNEFVDSFNQFIYVDKNRYDYESMEIVYNNNVLSVTIHKKDCMVPKLVEVKS